MTESAPCGTPPVASSDFTHCVNLNANMSLAWAVVGA
jgi:hypothetical protein